MPSIYDLKPAFQNLLRPLCRTFVAAGVTANQVTLSAVALSLASGAAIYGWPQDSWPLFLVPAVLFARMALNAIDGMLARGHDQDFAERVFRQIQGFGEYGFRGPAVDRRVDRARPGHSRGMGRWHPAGHGGPGSQRVAYCADPDH